MATLLQRTGFAVVECWYFFIALTPALWVRSVLAKRASRDGIVAASGLTVTWWIDAVPGAVSALGDRLLRPLRSVMGGSLLAVARLRS